FFGRGEHGASVAANDSARLQTVFGAAIRAARRPGMGNVEIYARVHAPEWCLGSGAVHRQVFGADFNGFGGGRGGGSGCGHGSVLKKLGWKDAVFRLG